MAQPKPWSYTALTDFKNCPRQFYEKRVLKSVKDEGGEALVWGNQVHKAFELFVGFGRELPDMLRVHEPFLTTLRDARGTVKTEEKVALNRRLQPCGQFDEDVWWRGVLDYHRVNGRTADIVDYKGLALDTRLPTPQGWTTMRDVQEGDQLVDMDGQPCTVIGKSEIKWLDCYRITFDDGASVICDQEHLWRLSDGSVQCVTDIGWTVTATQRLDVPTVRVAAPMVLPNANLPVDPYVLGLWLADGNRGRGVICKPDPFVWAEVQRRGYSVDMATGIYAGREGCPQRTLHGLADQLRQAGVLGAKHIPATYLRASYAQRLDLLRGLMDGDGSPNPARKQCVYMTTDRQLADQVAELLRSLGQRPSVAVTTQTGFGLTVTAHPVSFRPVGINPFLLPRKAVRVDPDWGPGRSAHRRIDKIERVPTIPTQCIAVDSPTHTFLCTEHMIPTHNTGKVKPDWVQLYIFAIWLFTRYPEVTSVNMQIYWTTIQSADSKLVTRPMMPDLWRHMTGDLRLYAQSFKRDIWPEKPSGLCNGWCPVKHCQHWKPKRN